MLPAAVAVQDSIENHLRKSSEIKLALIAHSSAIDQIIQSLVKIVAAGGRIYTCGNGGSACDAIHFAEELVARYQRERPGIPAQHLCDAGTITCWANDYSFDSVFQRQVETYLTKKDALVCFSTSGQSANIIAALHAAKKIGATTIALLGKGGGDAMAIATRTLVVPSDHTAHIQEAHITVVHIICDQLEQQLFPKSQ